MSSIPEQAAPECSTKPRIRRNFVARPLRPLAVSYRILLRARHLWLSGTPSWRPAVILFQNPRRSLPQTPRSPETVLLRPHYRTCRRAAALLPLLREKPLHILQELFERFRPVRNISAPA